MPTHASLTGADLHEPKGAASASVGTVYVATGGGSGTWKKIPSSSLDATSIKNINKFFLTARFDDISTADTVLIPCPNACVLSKATLILHASITGADSTVTFTNSTGPTTIGTLAVTFSGSAEGSIFTFTPSSNNSFTAGSYLKIATDGASSTTSKTTILLEFTLS